MARGQEGARTLQMGQHLLLLLGPCSLGLPTSALLTFGAGWSLEVGVPVQCEVLSRIPDLCSLETRSPRLPAVTTEMNRRASG